MNKTTKPAGGQAGVNTPLADDEGDMGPIGPSTSIMDRAYSFHQIALACERLNLDPRPSLRFHSLPFNHEEEARHVLHSLGYRDSLTISMRVTLERPGGDAPLSPLYQLGWCGYQVTCPLFDRVEAIQRLDPNQVEVIRK